MNLRWPVIKGIANLALSAGLIIPFVLFVFSSACEATSLSGLFKGLALFLLALLGTSNIVGKDRLHAVGLLFEKFVDAIKPTEDGMVDSLVKHRHAIYCITGIVVLVILGAIFFACVHYKGCQIMPFAGL